MKCAIVFAAAALFLCVNSFAQEGEGAVEQPAAVQETPQVQQNKEEAEFKYERPKWGRMDSKKYKKSYQLTDDIIRIIEKHLFLKEEDKQFRLDDKLMKSFIKKRNYHTASKNQEACLTDFMAYCETGELLRTVEKEVASTLKIKLNPVGSPIASNREKLAESEVIRNEVKKHFPESPAEIRKKAEKAAALKYPLIPKGKKVKITYRKGRRFYNIEGVYYGGDRQGKTIQVGSKVVSLRDLDKSLLPLYSTVLNQKSRKEMVEKAVQEYQRKRFAYQNELIDMRLEEDRRKNESNHFIYYPIQDKKNGFKNHVYGWATPEKVVKELISYVANAVKEPLAAEIVREKALEAEAEARRREAEKARLEKERQNQNNSENNTEEEEEEGEE